MRHQCSACARDFFDASGGLPGSDRVHCVFCGTRIRLRGARTTPARVVPFSDDSGRQEAAALGIIGPVHSDYPETLKQFRVRAARPSTSTSEAADNPRATRRVGKTNGDSLMPVAQGPETTSGALESRSVRARAFSLSVALGFAVGVAVAGGAAFLNRGPDRVPASASDGHAARRNGSEAVRASAAAGRIMPSVVALASVTNSAAPLPAPASSTPRKATPTNVVPTTAPLAARVAALPAVAVKPQSPMLDLRSLVQRARAEQRRYRLFEAERLYGEVLAAAPHDSEAIAGLGEVELLRGTDRAAEARFQEALRANENYVPALIALADIHWHSGRADEARRAYQSIVDQYSTDLYPPYVQLRSQSTSSACGR